MSLSNNRFLTVRAADTPTAVRTQDQSLAVYATDIYTDQFQDGLYFDASAQLEVEQAFGTASEVAKATSLAFGHSLAPQKVRIAFWNKAGVPIIARPNSLTATKSPLAFLSLASAYNFTINSRNVTEQVAYTVNTDDVPEDYDEFVTELNKALAPSSRFVFKYNNGVFSVESKVSGKDVDTDNIAVSGQIAEDLRLTSARGAKQIRGIDAKTGVVQSPTDLISELDDKAPNYYGFYSTVPLSDTDLEEFQERLSSSLKPHLFAYTVTADYMLDYESTNPLYRIASKNPRNMIVQLNKLGQNHAVVQLLVEASSTNWSGQKTAKTMKFKVETGVMSDESITTTIANKADRLGINYYTDYDGNSFNAEGRTLGTELFFIDSTVGRDAYIEDLRAAAATRLIQTPKIPQTDEGQVQLEGALIQVHEKYVRNGFLGAGLVWNNISFGELKTGDVLELGYYMYSDPYTMQSQSDREARKAMPIQIAAKEAGAIHSAEILVYLER